MINKSKRIKKVLYIGLLLLSFSCGGGGENAIPEGVLPKEELIPVIVDLQILESHFQRQFARADVYRDALDSSSNSVFEAHGVTRDQFSESMEFYSQDPDTLFLIYEAALDTINFKVNGPGNAPVTDFPQ